MPSDLALRAERLGVSLFMFGLVNQPTREAMEATWPLLDLDEVSLFRYADDEDIAIANACLQAEGERRSRQWQALERLSEFSTPAAGYMRDDLTREQSLAAVGSLLDLGWWSEAPEDPDED